MPDIRDSVARALFNKGVRLGVLRRYEEAIALKKIREPRSMPICRSSMNATSSRLISTS
jgi:hypothetical protein